jgi:AraC family transcriptional regulator of adaptative response / DNA-3-methyladenine glycosylase II
MLSGMESAATDTAQREVFERARLARDARFDGHFYIGVRTTGIYCRPICPANAPRSENVRFFASAAAAGEAGYRPCLRCRPETAPGSPAWRGTSTTVQRGLRLIAGGALDDGNIESLAERLGVTGRHLRRLFAQHIGASPLAVAHTQRLHFAKRLIDETRLTMQQIAEAAGYGSVRRFNDAFRKAYGRSPRDLRRYRDDHEGDRRIPTLTMRLPYRRPFDWQSMLAFFQPRTTAGVETVKGDSYWRTISLGGEHGILQVAPHRSDGYLSLTLTGPSTGSLFEIVQRIREVFDLDAPVEEITCALREDSLLAGPLGRLPGPRVPGAWDGFELAVRAIVGQQVSVAAATTIAGRIAARYGESLRLADPFPDVGLSLVFPSPQRLAFARFNDVGLVGQRIQTIRALAQAVVDGQVDFDFAQDPQAFVEKLKSIRGIGNWTAEYVAMRALKNPDAFPASDLGLRKATGDGTPAPTRTLEDRAESWRPWRAYAAMLLWNSSSISGA